MIYHNKKEEAQISTPQKNYQNTTTTTRQKQIEDIVLQSLSLSPTRSREITARTGLNGSEIREAVHSLRLQGYRICSGSPGYWLWNGKDDTWQHTKNHIRSRAMKELQLWSAMEGQPIPGQEQIYMG